MQGKFAGAKFDDINDYLEETRNIEANRSESNPARRKQLIRAVKRIEKGLGLIEGDCLIHYRPGKQAEITSLGYAVKDEFERLWVVMNRWRRLARHNHRGVELRIGIRNMHWQWIIKPWYQRILERANGRVSIDLISDYPKGLRRKLARGELDLCILYEGYGQINEHYHKPECLSHQKLVLIARRHPQLATRCPTLESIIKSGYFHYIAIKRDTRTYRREHDKLHRNQPFFSLPKHHFTSTSIAWDYFTSEQAQGAVGYFSERKWKKLSPRQRTQYFCLDQYTISRPLVVYQKHYPVHKTDTATTPIWDYLQRKPNHEIISHAYKNALLDEVHQLLRDEACETV